MRDDKVRHVCKCKRCGHVWLSRDISPAVCAKCRNPWWDKERKRVKGNG